jgi:hypothetical protein
MSAFAKKVAEFGGVARAERFDDVFTFPNVANAKAFGKWLADNDFVGAVRTGRVVRYDRADEGDVDGDAERGLERLRDAAFHVAHPNEADGYAD